jgi:hypothetical protein
MGTLFFPLVNPFEKHPARCQENEDIKLFEERLRNAYVNFSAAERSSSARPCGRPQGAKDTKPRQRRPEQLRPSSIQSMLLTPATTEDPAGWSSTTLSRFLSPAATTEPAGGWPSPDSLPDAAQAKSHRTMPQQTLLAAQAGPGEASDPSLGALDAPACPFAEIDPDPAASDPPDQAWTGCCATRIQVWHGPGDRRSACLAEEEDAEEEDAPEAPAAGPAWGPAPAGAAAPLCRSYPFFLDLSLPDPLDELYRI